MALAGWLVVDLAINWIGWAVAALNKTEKFYDLVGSISFITLTGGSLLLSGPITARKIVVSCMVGLWTLRLGSYLLKRVLQTGSDKRFDNVRDKPGTFFIYWTMQAVWVWVTLLPVLLINCSLSTAPLTAIDAAGLLVYAAGLGIEAVADWQKDRFRAKEENHGKFITQGLWSISRHPNYFGEIVLWFGLWLTCATSFQGAQFASVASPAFVYFLLRYVSGVPILERTADARWGSQPEYQQYKQRTPILVPFINFGDGKNA